MKLVRDIFCSIYKSVIGIGPSLYHSQVKPLGASVGLLFGEPYLPGSNLAHSYQLWPPNHSKWFQIDPNHSGSFRFIPNHFKSHLPLTSPLKQAALSGEVRLSQPLRAMRSGSPGSDVSRGQGQGLSRDAQRRCQKQHLRKRRGGALQLTILIVTWGFLGIVNGGFITHI